jgi:hypothetical protein
LLDDADWGELPAVEVREQFAEERCGVAFNGKGGEAVGDDEGEIGRR